MKNTIKSAASQLLTLIALLQNDNKILNTNEFTEVLKALKSIHANEKLIDTLIHTMETLVGKELGYKNQLTTREKQVLLLIGRNHQNQSIATRLNLSKSTVETHRKNIRKKLKLKTQDNLLVFAMIYSLQHEEYQNV